MRPRLLLALALSSFLLGRPQPAAADPPAGPLLLVASASNPFGRYVGEILLAEGLGVVPTADVADLSPELLASRQIVVLGQTPLSEGQAQVLSDWVEGGGKLIAMRPDKQLAGLLGLSDRGAVLSNAYLAVDTTSGPGAGVTGISLQFHGDADLYGLSGATAVASLWSDAGTPTAAPAVSRVAVGESGGEAAAFTYDLARSVVYTRQGNPAWIWMERDGIGPLRPDDLFFGPSLVNPAPNWVDFDRIAIPQADEQQRLLVNLIQEMMDDRTPLPRLWYFPRGLSAVLVMTGDDHAHGGTAGRFAQYRSYSPPGCSVADWECVRSTSYIYPGTPITEIQAEQSLADGFEIGLHVNTHAATVTGPVLDTMFTGQWAALSAQLPGVPPPSTNRNHTVTWSGWATTAQVERQHGVRLDTNYYYWPPQWVQNRPGLFTGSGIPMRFADLDGSLVDVYQLTTQMTDESGQSYPYTIHSLLDAALGPSGYVGAFCANMHTDFNPWPQSDQIVGECRGRGVPIISSKQMLDWLDGRNGSGCALQSWSGDSLRFQVTATELARGLTAMLPLEHHGRALSTLQRDGAPLEWTVRTVKGVAYAFFDAESGTHLAVWTPKGNALQISAITTSEGPDQLLRVSWTTSAAGTGGVDYGLSPTELTGSVSVRAFSTEHEFSLPPPAPGATVWYRVRSAGPFGAVAITPALEATPAGFVSPRDACASDRTDDQFALADTLRDTWVAHDQPGAVVLRPAVGAEFSATELPAGWTLSTDPGGSGELSGGRLRLHGASVRSEVRGAAGHTLEFEAAFTAPGQRAGLASDDAFVGVATDSPGAALELRAGADSDAVAIPIAGAWLGAVHRYQVEWETDSVRVSIDDRPAAACAGAVAESLQVAASDSGAGPPLELRWMRQSPYAASGVFVSRALDAGTPGSFSLTWAADLPDPTSIGIEIRSGGSPVPDGSWSPFHALSGTSAGLGPGPRYFQYRATLGTTDPDQTPSLRVVALSCDAPAGVGPTGPAVTRLRAPWPNPMSAATRIAWDTAPAQSDDRLRIRVYDIAGRCVRTLVDGRSTVGAHQLSWDGRDDRGDRLRPGIFRVRLEARGLDRTEPVVLLR